MSNYRLDDLMDWGRVLEELEELRKRGLLDEHQTGITRILRYKRNWRLRECALACAKNLSRPEDHLIMEVCTVMCDEDSYPELRMLAAEAIADLLCNCAGSRDLSFEGLSIPEKMRQLLATPLSPLFVDTLQKTLIRIEEDVR